jgi:S1-C subfamily serine protease
MKFAVACLCSAIIGGLVAVWLVESRITSSNSAIAQERFREGPALPSDDAPPAMGNLRPNAGWVGPATPAPLPAFAADGLTPEERINVAVYERVNKSVAHITLKGARSDSFWATEVPAEGTGSGSVIDRQGHILTNYHVVEDARQVEVTLFDGKTYDAKFVGADPINDTCIIKIDAAPEVLFPVTFGDSRRLKVGMRVFAIGNPFGLERTLTTGIVSSLNRSLQIHQNRTIKSIIQIDAAINPGNSGGPLLDTSGRLIGMNTAIASKTGQNSGVGFAIPSTLIARIVPQIIQNGSVIRPEAGISKVFQTERGLLIAKLIPGGPAERAGLRGPAIGTKRRGPFAIETVDRSAADMIIAVDGEKAITADDFLGLIEAHAPGETVMLTIIRQGRQVQVPVQLSSTAELTPRTR